MQILLIILHREDLLDDVLSVLVEMEITGAIVLDGTSMERVLAEDVPIFAGLLETIGRGAHAKAILAPVPDRDVLESLVPLLEEVGADFSSPDLGRVFSIPVDFHLGPETGQHT